jgi:hypothetical protein
MAVTSALGMLPGRKTVVFFAEGLAIPDAALPHFRNVVTTANRANVSIYTVDSAGLRVHSQDGATAREMTAMAALGTTLSPDGSNLSSLAMLERNEDVLRKDPRTALALLAGQTGGFLIENTNDLAGAFRRIDADRRFHYLLTYVPRRTEADGRWRTVAVKVKNRDLIVRARTGYLAVGGASTLPVLAYEAPALAALDRSPAPVDLPIRSGAFVFPGASGTRAVVLAATDAAAIRFDRDAAASLYRTDFTIVSRVVDANGATLRKSSQPYRLSGPIAQVDQAARGQVLFFRQPQLPPGRYTLETAVHDALSGRTGVHRTPFVVPDAAARSLQVSSLVLVSRAERVKPEAGQKNNPLYVGDALIYPNLGEPVDRARQKALTFFVSMAGLDGGPPAASMEVWSGPRKLAEGAITLPPPDAQGRIDHVLQIPLDALGPGAYRLRLTVSHGERVEVRDADFVLE